jgi:hypothetical protein
MITLSGGDVVSMLPRILECRDPATLERLGDAPIVDRAELLGRSVWGSRIPFQAGMMEDMIRRLVVPAAVLLAGCTQGNPGFNTVAADLAGSAAADLAVPAGADLAVPTGAGDLASSRDLAGAAFDLALDLAAPGQDGGPLDLSVPDLATADLRTAVDLRGTPDLFGRESLPPPDLAGVDAMWLTCSGVPCIGCCVTGVCIAVGQSCGTASSVCTVIGCQQCGNLSQPCCGGRNCSSASLTCEPGLETCGNCGRPGGRCCNGGTCVAGGCCDSGNTCVPSGKTCGASAVCLDSVCTACGTDGQACCENVTCGTTGCCNPATRKCVSSTAPCGSGTCSLGACGSCGKSGLACCDAPFPSDAGVPAVCSSAGTVCAAPGGGGAQCASCGTEGNPCCGANTCLGGGCCVGGTCHGNNTSCGGGNGDCSDGSCSGGTCGGLFQPCCAGNLCTAPDTRCVTGSCRSCGGRDQICCTDAAGVTDFCEPPYVPRPDILGDCHCRKG